MDAVIVEAVRSAVAAQQWLSGASRRTVRTGALRARQAAGIDPGIVDDVIWGCVMQAGEALDIARTAVLTAGWRRRCQRDRRPAMRLESTECISPLPAWSPVTMTS